MVVDLAIEDDRVASIDAVHRLVATRDIEDAEPPASEAKITIGQNAGHHLDHDGGSRCTVRLNRGIGDRHAPDGVPTPQFRT